MACKIYEELLRRSKYYREEWAYFAYPHNELIRGTSKTKSKKLATKAKDEMNEINRRMISHREGCEKCKQSPEGSQGN
jgi:hypothetical protein